MSRYSDEKSDYLNQVISSFSSSSLETCLDYLKKSGLCIPQALSVFDKRNNDQESAVNFKTDSLAQIYYLKQGSIVGYRTDFEITKDNPIWKSVKSCFRLLEKNMCSRQDFELFEEMVDAVNHSCDGFFCALLMVYDDNTVEIFCLSSEMTIDFIEYALFGDMDKIEDEFQEMRRTPHEKKRQYQERSLSFPDGITFIGDSYLKGSLMLEQLTIPDTVKRIGREAFCGCKNLKELILPDGVSIIGEAAFEDCENLAQVILPGKVQYVFSSLFKSCKRLSAVDLSAETRGIGEEAFMNCAELREIEFPCGLEIIEERAFKNCTSLQSIFIPPNVILQDSAFRNCSGLKKIKCSEGVVFSGESIFENCAELTDVVLPDDLTFLEWYSFRGCVNLESLTIPDSVTRVGIGILDDCERLKVVSIPEHLKEARAFYKITDKLVVRS